MKGAFIRPTIRGSDAAKLPLVMNCSTYYLRFAIVLPRGQIQWSRLLARPCFRFHIARHTHLDVLSGFLPNSAQP